MSPGFQLQTISNTTNQSILVEILCRLSANITLKQRFTAQGGGEATNPFPDFPGCQQNSCINPDVAGMLPSLLRILAKRAGHFASECLDIYQRTGRNCGCLCLDWIYQEEFNQVRYPSLQWKTWKLSTQFQSRRSRRFAAGDLPGIEKWPRCQEDSTQATCGMCKRRGAKKGHRDNLKPHEFFCLQEGLQVDFRVLHCLFQKLHNQFLFSMLSPYLIFI